MSVEPVDMVWHVVLQWWCPECHTMFASAAGVPCICGNKDVVRFDATKHEVKGLKL